MQRRVLLALCASAAMAALPAAAGPVPAAVFQWSVPVEHARGTAEAFLWISPEAKQVRGVVMGGMTLMERECVKDAVIRKACADQQLAIVFLKCGLGGPDLQKVLEELAKVSGYGELANAPLLFIGHSAGGPQAKAMAAKFASRCFGLVQYRGGVPGGGESIPPGIPALMMVGQYDEFGGTMRDANGNERPWEGGRAGIVSFRSANEANLGSIVVEPGAGHFSWSDRNAPYLGMFIAKAAKARIPDWSPDAREPVKCKEIDHRSGWLTDLTIRAPGEFSPAPYEKFKGEAKRAAWHFDEEIAKATVAYHAGGFGRKDQFIKWSDGYWVDAGSRFFFTGLKWVDDGATFEVHPVYADQYPGQYNGQGPKWHKAGESVGNSGVPIQIKQASGPVVVVPGTHKFRMQFDGLAPASEGGRVTFMAFSVGNAEYRYTEHVGMMPRGFPGLKGGKPQTITFEQPANLKAGGGGVELKAASDAGLPVEFYVAVGPAVVKGGKLEIAELPARAALPAKVKVVAWQFGNGIKGQEVQTAAPVEHVIHVGK
jgi:hypothetical protein